MKIRIVCISDTHTMHRQIANLPAGDILIHAGDSTNRGSKYDIEEFGDWLREQPHKHKVVISGNHDFLFEKDPTLAELTLLRGPNGGHGVHYLKDSEVTLDFDGTPIRIYGSPWQPWFHNWAFNLHRGAPLKEKWDMIPEGIDILITHGPVAGILDRCDHGERVGCRDLADAIARTKPKLHVCGHIHEDYGVLELGSTTYVNASTCTLEYRPLNAPLVFDLENGKITQIFGDEDIYEEIAQSFMQETPKVPGET